MKKEATIRTVTVRNKDWIFQEYGGTREKQIDLDKISGIGDEAKRSEYSFEMKLEKAEAIGFQTKIEEEDTKKQPFKAVYEKIDIGERKAVIDGKIWVQPYAVDFETAQRGERKWEQILFVNKSEAQAFIEEATKHIHAIALKNHQIFK